MEDKHGGMNKGMGMGYGRFAAMIATSTVVMFGLMYLNTYALSHVEFSQTRMWMAVVMGATMALIMIGFTLLFFRGVSELIKRIAVMRGLIPDPYEGHKTGVEAEVEHLVEVIKND